MTERIETVGKLEVAARQLREAILLFFEDRDPIAIHTLAAASHQVLVDLASQKNGVSILKDNPLIRPQRKKEWMDALNKPHNFFKHSDRDATDVLEFRPAMTPFFLFDAVQIHSQLTLVLPHEQNVFLAWFNAKNPDLLDEGPLKDAINMAFDAGLDPSDLRTFLALALSGIR